MKFFTRHSHFLIAIVFLFLYSFFAVIWFKQGYFQFLDIFFDADPKTNIDSFAHGTWGRNALSHAFIEIIAIPIRAISLIAWQFHLVEDQVYFREFLAIFISPLVSAIKLVFFFKILENLGVERKFSLLLTLVYALSFTNLIFSSIPETYSISSLFICMLIYLFVKEARSGHRAHTSYWTAIGLALTGTTITNGALFFIAYTLSLYFNGRLPLFKAIVRSSLVSFCVLLVVIVIFYLSRYMLAIEGGSEGTADWASSYTVKNLYQAFGNILNFSSVSILSYFPLGFSTQVNLDCPNYNVSCNSISLQFGFSSFILWCAAILFFLLIFVSYLKAKRDRKTLNFYYLCVLLIAFNFALHTVFGRETFLYTQHWITPLFLLVYPLVHTNYRLLILIIFTQISLSVFFIVTLEQMISLQGQI